MRTIDRDGGRQQFGRSLRFRLTVLFAVVTSAAIGSVGLFLDYSLSAQLASREREELQGKLVLFRHLLAEIPSRTAIPSERHRLLDVLVGHGDLQAALIDETGRRLLDFPTFDWPAALVAQASVGTHVEERLPVHGRFYRFLLAKAPIGESVDSVVVAIAHDTTENDQILSWFRNTVLFASVIGSLLAGGLGYFAAKRGLQPLRSVADAAKRISAERLSDRLQSKNVPIELHDLAESFNAMLARLEGSFRRLSEFSSDLAHELRTPIGNLLLQAQVALDKPRNEVQLRQVLESSLEELGRLSRMANDMLFLAKADHAQLILRRERLMLEDEVGKVLEFFEALAAERALELRRDGSACIHADRSMIRRALANLMSNAVRHAVSGSTVTVALGQADSRIVIDVTNEGSTLSEDEAARVFDRFFRAESSRSLPAEGAGLGLAIVKSIVELHEGQVSAASRNGRTTFRVTLPPAPSSPA